MPKRLLVVVIGMLTLLFAAATTATAAEVQTVDQDATSARERQQPRRRHR